MGIEIWNPFKKLTDTGNQAQLATARKDYIKKNITSHNDLIK